MESMQHVSRSGEKGRTASLWLVGESRLLYVRTKGNIAEALSYNLLMYRGGHMGKRGIYLSKYIYGTPKAKNHARHLRKTMTRKEVWLMS